MGLLEFGKGILTMVFFLLPLSTALGASPESVVNQFYKYHFSHDMGFTSDAVKQRSEWFTSQLMETCRAYFAIPQNPDEAPVINGDPFTDSQEYPNSFSVGSAKISETSARVPVTFTWKEDGHSRKTIIALKRMGGKWLIDDLEYSDQNTMRHLLATAPANP